jgi:group II intron reverse transcriptase/maturase
MVKKLRVHSLTGRITPKEMGEAYKAVRRNHGAKGLDGISIEMFNANLEQNLAKLMQELKDRTYQPIPLKRVYIPKDMSKTPKMRPLGIPAVRCRVAQEVVRRLLNPIFEEIFHPMSFGFRPGRNCHQAITQVKKYLDEGYKWVVDADIKGFFDNIPHDVIMETEAEIADGNILGLIRRFLKSGVMEEGILKPTTKGTPQGGVISPLLANITLNELDWALEEKGYKFVRYADDFVILCQSKQQADEALATAKHIIENRLGLELSPEKTKISHLCGGFNFLGFTFHHKGLKMCEKAVEKFKAKVKNATTRCHNLDDEAIKGLNLIIRGTMNYFALPFASIHYQLRTLDQWIRMRIRCMKYKRISKNDNSRMRNRTIHRGFNLLSCLRLYLAVRSGLPYSPAPN